MEITIKIDHRKKEAKAFLEFIKSLSFVKIEEVETTQRYNNETEKAIKEARSGKASQISLTDFRKQLHS